MLSTVNTITWPQPARAVYMSTQMVQGLLTAGRSVAPFDCIEGIPEGATLLGVSLDAQRGAIKLIFSHPDWELVPDPARIPLQRVALTAKQNTPTV